MLHLEDSPPPRGGAAPGHLPPPAPVPLLVCHPYCWGRRMTKPGWRNGSGGLSSVADWRGQHRPSPPILETMTRVDNDHNVATMSARSGGYAACPRSRTNGLGPTADVLACAEVTLGSTCFTRTPGASDLGIEVVVSSFIGGDRLVCG
jgi:hypothetical protein